MVLFSATGVSSSGSTVNSGTKVTFTANPNKGYAVEGWYNDAECTKKIESAGTNKTYTVTVNADTNVYVKFHTAETYTVTFSSSDGNIRYYFCNERNNSTHFPCNSNRGRYSNIHCKTKGWLRSFRLDCKRCISFFNS